MPEPTGDITKLLHRWRQGSRDAENDLFDRVFPNLRRLAHHFMKRERPDHTLQATELVNQIYFKMVAAKDRDWQSRRHFFAIAARAMRRYLIDHARGRPRAEFVTLVGFDEILAADSGKKIDVALTVDMLLDDLAKTQPDWSMLVEMKYFLGLTDEEAADAMGLKLRTMQRMWRDARKWLFERMDSAKEQALERDKAGEAVPAKSGAREKAMDAPAKSAGRDKTVDAQAKSGARDKAKTGHAQSSGR